MPSPTRMRIDALEEKLTKMRSEALYDTSAEPKLRTIMRNCVSCIVDAQKAHPGVDITGIVGMAIHFAAEEGVRHPALAPPQEGEVERLRELLWQLYEGIYGHRKAEGIDPFKTAVGGALELKKAWEERGYPAERELSLLRATQSNEPKP